MTSIFRKNKQMLAMKQIRNLVNEPYIIWMIVKKLRAYASYKYKILREQYETFLLTLLNRKNQWKIEGISRILRYSHISNLDSNIPLWSLSQTTFNFEEVPSTNIRQKILTVQENQNRWITMMTHQVKSRLSSCFSMRLLSLHGRLDKAPVFAVVKI